MAVKVSSISAVVKHLTESADITNSIEKTESDYLSDATTTTFNGETVYIKDYCPLCHGVVTVVDKDGNIIATTYNGKGSTVDTSTGGNALSPNTKTSVVDGSSGSSSGGSSSGSSSGTKSGAGLVVDGISDQIVLNDDNSVTMSENVINKINSMIKTYMGTTVYDTNNDGVVDQAVVALTANNVDWSNVTGKPAFDDDTLVKVCDTYHSHGNLYALNYIGIDTVNMLPTWNEEAWPEQTSVSQHIAGGKYLRNIFTSNNKPTNANTGDVWFNINSTSNIDGIYVKRDADSWYSFTTEKLVTTIVSRVVDSFSSGSLSSFSHNSFSDLQGGDGDDEYYHITEKQHRQLRVLIDRLENQQLAKAYDGLDSSSTTDALSAHQGKVLLEKIEAIQTQLNWLTIEK